MVRNRGSKVDNALDYQYRGACRFDALLLMFFRLNFKPRSRPHMTYKVMEHLIQACLLYQQLIPAVSMTVFFPN